MPEKQRASPSLCILLPQSFCVTLERWLHRTTVCIILKKSYGKLACHEKAKAEDPGKMKKSDASAKTVAGIKKKKSPPPGCNLTALFGTAPETSPSAASPPLPRASPPSSPGAEGGTGDPPLATAGPLGAGRGGPGAAEPGSGAGGGAEPSRRKSARQRPCSAPGAPEPRSAAQPRLPRRRRARPPRRSRAYTGERPSAPFPGMGTARREPRGARAALGTPGPAPPSRRWRRPPPRAPPPGAGGRCGEAPRRRPAAGSDPAARTRFQSGARGCPVAATCAPLRGGLRAPESPAPQLTRDGPKAAPTAAPAQLRDAGPGAGPPGPGSAGVRGRGAGRVGLGGSLPLKTLAFVSQLCKYAPFFGERRMESRWLVRHRGEWLHLVRWDLAGPSGLGGRLGFEGDARPTLCVLC